VGSNPTPAAGLLEKGLNTKSAQELEMPRHIVIGSHAGVCLAFGIRRDNGGCPGNGGANAAHRIADYAARGRHARCGTAAGDRRRGYRRNSWNVSFSSLFGPGVAVSWPPRTL
jgi:hypothetical protein